MSETEVMKGSSIPNFDAYVDGWQAYCAGMDESVNPYFIDRTSEDYLTWRRAYANARRADENGNLGETGPAVRAYHNRHPFPDGDGP